MGDMMGPVMDNFLNHYRYKFQMNHLVPGQGTNDIFEFDYRNTYSPQIYNGHADFFIAGDLMYRGQGCNLTNDNLDFLPESGYTVGDSQIVISESVVTCWAN
jgi:hypothetical protein